MEATKFTKLLRILPVAVTRPTEFYDRIRSVVKVSKRSGHLATYSPTNLDSALEILECNTGLDIRSRASEAAFSEVESSVRLAWEKLDGGGPFSQTHNADDSLARTSYSIVRGLRPNVVVETGVCYGVTSAYILQAMQANEVGRLYSVDLPPLGKHADRFVGVLVAEQLRSRWTLQRGSSQRLLAPLLEELGEIDLFIHDSLHTYEHMKFEFQTAWTALRSGGILVSDDIEGNAAFSEHSSLPDVKTALTIKFSEGNALFGVVVKR